MSTYPYAQYPQVPAQPPTQPPTQPPASGPTFPAVYYSYKSIAPPIVMQNQAMVDRMNAMQPGEWDTVPPSQPAAAGRDDYPKVFYNVNIEPRIITSNEEETTLGTDWKQFQLSQDVIEAAQKALKAKAAAQAK
ncbi:MAG: hypothetical protein C5B60_11445 [Chloroflexi bacterium]|nr:MAG: hypothetical protein C5B60_11445 [Chloroflexota bacterium]